MASTVRVMTANLWGKHVNADGLAAVIDEVDPDVIALQELTPPAAEVIESRFGHDAMYPQRGYRGTGIASRYPAEFVRTLVGRRTVWIARLGPDDWPSLERAFEVVAIHFANPIRWPIWDSLATRREQLESLTSHLAGARTPRAVVGDFNASPVWPVYRAMTRVTDDAAKLAGSARRTWSPRAHGPPLLRIDHVFVQHTVAVAVTTVTIPGSDHRGVVADLRPGLRNAGA